MATNEQVSEPTSQPSDFPPPGKHDVPKSLTPPQLHPQEQSQLLDDIDKLKSLGISKYISLPQLVVCGDQSAGKSSVLEAISLTKFPTNEGLCTRFATELIMRRTDKPRVSVSIRPGPTRTEEERQRLLNFHPKFSSPEDFPGIIEQARKVLDLMPIGSNTNAFSDDVLCIENSGPDRPHLTLVDLPGLIRNETERQTDKDIEVAKQLVESYMEQPRTIILAVVSAQNDYANQEVLKMARNFDPNGERTLGIITKPDTLDAGFGKKADWIKLAKNGDKRNLLALGWHVLKNKGQKEKNATAEERDKAEAEYFRDSEWLSCKQSSLGITALRSRLSGIFLQHIAKDLENVVREIREEITTSKSRVAKLGPSRPTTDEQRTYLIGIGKRFSDLVKYACDGIYNDHFFRAESELNPNLRAIIQNLNEEFSRRMTKHGHSRQIVDGFQGFGNTARNQISRTAFMSEIGDLVRVNRGTELPRTTDPKLVGHLFYQQARPWREIAEEHITNVWEAAKEFLELALGSATNASTFDIVLKEHVDPRMDERLSALREKLNELLKQHESGHPITYNPRYLALEEDYERRQKERSVGNTEASFSDLLDLMDRYYKVALDVFIDNVAVLAVENCLMSDLPEIFSPTTISHMSSEDIAILAAEREDVQRERNYLTEKIKVLEISLKTCNRHVARAPTGNRKKISPAHMRGLYLEDIC
ncbi:hypothetical protein M501DRAFT_437516 [Patellaria atrata CBS 101060]|uniref:Dynamin family protein n=1 Tax=Patellaria atrata CBS 101060 TaxID=1346257 RepID=A0A9P4VJQ1_9PEZI|nr:hypothetical protein M501DRAFT_437516 [Patellaria atrata CBS 101060]